MREIYIIKQNLPEICTSKGTGRTEGLKLNIPIRLSMPNQSAKSLAFAKAVDNPIILNLLVVCDEMKFVLETITSKTGPRSSPKMLCKIFNHCTQ